jgi:hypothetical protein
VDKLEASFVTVSNRVGMGPVPETRLGRIYRDLLGKANQLLASHATEVYLIVACLPVQGKRAMTIPHRPAFSRHQLVDYDSDGKHRASLEYYQSKM